MKLFIPLFAASFLIVNIAQAQSDKANLRDFTPGYIVDTFTVKGIPGMVKRGVILLQKTEGIKSAFWDDANYVLTVQYNRKLVHISAIKNFFQNGQSLIAIDQNPEPGSSFFIVPLRPIR